MVLWGCLCFLPGMSDHVESESCFFSTLACQTLSRGQRFASFKVWIPRKVCSDGAVMT